MAIKYPKRPKPPKKKVAKPKPEKVKYELDSGKGEKKWFLAYYRVQLEGKFNMYSEAQEAAAEAGLTIEQYRYVAGNYQHLMNRYGSSDEYRQVTREVTNKLVGKDLFKVNKDNLAV
jgi:hypothetical protein